MSSKELKKFIEDNKNETFGLSHPEMLSMLLPLLHYEFQACSSRLGDGDSSMCKCDSKTPLNIIKTRIATTRGIANNISSYRDYMRKSEFVNSNDNPLNPKISDITKNAYLKNIIQYNLVAQANLMANYLLSKKNRVNYSRKSNGKLILTCPRDEYKIFREVARLKFILIRSKIIVAAIRLGIDINLLPDETEETKKRVMYRLIGLNNDKLRSIRESYGTIKSFPIFGKYGVVHYDSEYDYMQFITASIGSLAYFSSADMGMFSVIPVGYNLRKVNWKRGYSIMSLSKIKSMFANNDTKISIFNFEEFVESGVEGSDLSFADHMAYFISGEPYYL